MQTTSATWKSLWSSGEARLEVKAVIGGTDRSAELSAAPVISRGTMQNGLTIGSVVSATCALSLRAASPIARSASVALSMRLVNDAGTASEWLPAGTFYISRRAKDPVTGVTALECYDALLKANAAWTPSAGSWPRAMSAVATELATRLGVSIDSRTTIKTGNNYVIDEPDAGTSIHDVLSLIAESNGGNWIVTPEGKLRLVPILSAYDAAGAQTDVLDVDAVLSAPTVGAVEEITGVRSTVDGVATLTGDDLGIVIDTALTPVIAADLADDLIGLGHQPFRLPAAVYDPAVELGDYVRYGSAVAGVLCAVTQSLSPGPRGELWAPDPAELADEYPYIGGSEKALTLAKAYAREAVADLDDDLTQQEIFNRLTDNGAAQCLVLYNGQLYINATYINAGEMSADRIRGGILTLGGLNNIYGTLKLLDASGNEVGVLGNGGLDLTGASHVASMNLVVLDANGGNSARFIPNVAGEGGFYITAGFSTYLAAFTPDHAYFYTDVGTAGVMRASSFIGDVSGNCSGSSGSCTGNAATATKATQDADGNAIASTYLKRSAGNDSYLTNFLRMRRSGVINDVITFGSVAGTGQEYITTDQNEWGSLVYNFTAQNVSDGTYSTGARFRFREYSPTAAGGRTNFSELYDLPNADVGRTADATYSILTTKNTVTPAQGGTGLDFSYVDDSTWADLYAKLSKITNNQTAAVSFGNNAMSLLTGGKVTAGTQGQVSRFGSNNANFSFMAVGNTGSGVSNAIYTWRVTGWTSASVTPTVGTVYRYSGTAI